jgi:hypothetical protein
VGAALVAAAGALAWVSPQFAYEREVVDMPAATFGIGLALASLVWVGVVPLIQRTEDQSIALVRTALVIVLVCGCVMRGLAAGSTPILEDDWYRYLWEGGLVAHGLSPYAIVPEEARAMIDPAINALAEDAGTVLDRVNHAHLRTIYPPLAQAAFALAHLIEPWSLAAWRAVSLGLDIAMALLLVGILDALGRSWLWVAVYWLNPIVVKELVNTAHMEAVVMMPVLGAVLLALKGRHVAGALAMGLAAGAKVWPLLLLPLMLRPLLGDWPRLALTSALLVILGGAMAWPILAGGLDASSGFVAYAEHWQSNSALFPLLHAVMAALLPPFGNDGEAASLLASRLARGSMGGLAVGAALGLAIRPVLDAADLVRRAALIVFSIVLLSPAQFPWYMVWMIPFLSIVPVPGLVVAAVTTPLYYTYFHFSSRDLAEVFRTRIVWLIWVPVWVTLAVDLWRAGHAGRGGVGKAGPHA